MVPSQEGLTASIGSPTVNFNDYDKNSKFKSFRINFPIIDGALSYFNGAQIARIDLKYGVLYFPSKYAEFDTETTSCPGV